MMAVGEQTGKFGSTMQLIADVYERELDKQIKIVSTLIPPIVMIAIAAIVGLVVYGILSAVFGLTSGLRGGVHCTGLGTCARRWPSGMNQIEGAP